MSKKKTSSTNKIDKLSSRETFDRWCEECGDNLYDFSGVLSIAGSDGIKLTKDKIGKALFNEPKAVDHELEVNGYYEDCFVNMNTYYYHKPKMKYSEWFYSKYLK